MIDHPDRADGGSSVVLDNALLYSAANFLIRDRDQRTIRNVNLFGLAALADALVMHQRITVDRQGWDYFVDAVPAAWLPSIQPYVDIVDFELPSNEAVVDAMALSANSVLLGYGLTSIDHDTATQANRSINSNYFTYTGSDLGRDEEEADLVSLIGARLGLNIPPMHLHLRNCEHVNALQCLVRGVQYQYFAAELGQAYVPHEYRGRVLNILARNSVQPEFRQMWERLMAGVSRSIEKQYDEKLKWVRPDEDASFALWERLQMPLFLSMALERTKSANDLFHHVASIRNKAFGLRGLLERLTDAETQQDASEIARELRGLVYEIENPAPTKPGSIFSVSVGLPASLSLGINLPAAGVKRSVSFIRDIYDNHALPLSLNDDASRVFGTETQPLTLDPLRDVAPSENVLDHWFETMGSARKP